MRVIVLLFRNIFFCSGLFISRIVYAENKILAKTAQTSAGGISTLQISQILGGLMLVLLVIFWGAWLVKKLKFGEKISGNGLIKIISYLPLGTREKLLLINVGEEQLLISSGPQGITHLHTLQKNITIPVNAKATGSSFAQQLAHFLTLQNKSQKNQHNNSADREKK